MESSLSIDGERFPVDFDGTGSRHGWPLPIEHVVQSDERDPL